MFKGSVCPNSKKSQFFTYFYLDKLTILLKTGFKSEGTSTRVRPGDHFKMYFLLCIVVQFDPPVSVEVEATQD